MKYRLLIFIVVILASLLIKYLFPHKQSASYVNARKNQANPFTVHKDSAGSIWLRAKQYLKENKRLISGGDIIENDSVLFVPYYNSYKKGNCIQIEKHSATDSVTFLVQWWYSQNPEPDSEKEIALFMQYNIEDE